jgi:hypothetical protein
MIYVSIFYSEYGNGKEFEGKKSLRTTY